MMWNLKKVIVWFAILLLKYPFATGEEKLQKTNIYTSVWCFSSVFGKRCAFSNLCYNPMLKNFLFIIGNGSLISGINSKNDLKEISTTWFNHSHFYLKIALINSINEYRLINNNVLIMSKFKPDNIMHVIHDDLIPLFVTYKRICLGDVVYCSSKTQIIFVNKSYDPFHKLYEAFTYKQPFSLLSFDTVVCFSNVYIGLDSDSVFYQYGYEKPQGPIKPLISGELFYEFTEYILNYLKIERNVLPKFTLIGRKVNRKILNEKYLVELIKDIYNKKFNKSISFEILDINSSSIDKIINSIATSKLLLGMHGAGMILAMFLPFGSTVVELFPYGIVKEHVSALYSLAGIPGIHFHYLSWMNNIKENSLTHPEYSYLLGGFENISHSQIEVINKTIVVPAVYCCHDPLYLHFMYQDTYVDYSILPVIIKSFEIQKLTDSVEYLEKMWYFPSEVRNIVCSSNNTHLMLKWEPPINIGNKFESLYRLTVSGSEYMSTYVTKFHFINLNTFFSNKTVSIWIQCIFNGISGIDTYFVCDLTK